MKGKNGKGKSGCLNLCLLLPPTVSRRPGRPKTEKEEREDGLWLHLQGVCPGEAAQVPRSRALRRDGPRLLHRGGRGLVTAPEPLPALHMYISPTHSPSHLWTCYLLSWERCSRVVTSVFSLFSMFFFVGFFNPGNSFVVASVCPFGLGFFSLFWEGVFLFFFLVLLTKLET